MSSIRTWAPTGESSSELVASYDANSSVNTHVNSSTAAVSASPPIAAPPHPPRPIRKVAGLSSPSRLDEAIVLAAHNHQQHHHHHHEHQHHDHHLQQGANSPTPSTKESGEVDDSLAEHSPSRPQSASAAENASANAIALLSVTSNRQCDAFLDKIRTTSTKSGDAARMGDIAAATAKRAVDAHSPSRHRLAIATASSSAASSSSAVMMSPPSKFSVRLAVAQQRNAASSCANIVSESPSWNLHHPGDAADVATSAAGFNNNNDNFAVTGPAHLQAFLSLPASTVTGEGADSAHPQVAASAATASPAAAAAAAAAPTAITVAGAHGNDQVDGPLVTKLLEDGGVRSTTTALAIVDGGITEGHAMAELVRALCPTKVHSEKFLEEKTEEELEEEKAQLDAEKAEAEAKAQNAGAAGIRYEMDDEEDEVADYDYEAPKLGVPEHAVPPPKIPATMKESTRYIATKRDATSIQYLKIAKTPLAFITRSGAPALSLANPDPSQEEQPLIAAYNENAELVCDAPTAVEALGKYISLFRPELDYSEAEQQEMQAEADDNDREEQYIIDGHAHQGSGDGDDNNAATPDAEPVYRKLVPLRTLNLSENALGAVFPQIAPALTSAASLRSLDLSANGLGNPTSALEEALPRGVGGDGPVGGDEASQEDVAAALETLVKENKFLEHLSLADNEINGALALRVFAALGESDTRVPTPPPEDAPVFEPFEDEIPPPEFEGEDEVIPTEAELDAQERAEREEAEAAENAGSGSYDDGAGGQDGDEEAEEGDEEGAEEGGDEGADLAERDADHQNDAVDEEEEEEYDEEVLEQRRAAREAAEAAWREKMEDKIWSLQRRQSERDEDKARRGIYQEILDALVSLKNREILKRKLAISQTAKRSTKERQRRGGFSRLTSLDMSGNNIGSEAAQALAQAIRYEVQMTEEELIAAKEAAGIVAPIGGGGDDYDGDGGFNERVPDDDDDDDDDAAAAAAAKTNKLEWRTRKVQRSRYVWRGPNEENDEEHEEAEEYEEDEEYEEEVEDDGDVNNNNNKQGENGDDEDVGGEDGKQQEEGEQHEAAAPPPAFKTTKPGLQTIEYLNLSRCHIGFKGLAALADVIADNCPSLKTLNLSNNPTCRKRIPDPVEVAARKQHEEDEAAGKIILDPPSRQDGGGGGGGGEEYDPDAPIRQIVDRNWTSPGIVHLAGAISKNTTLRCLDLSFNHINPNSLTALASDGFDKSPSNSALHTLCLDGNPFGPSSGADSDAGIALFTLLLSLTHTSVRRLSLDGCGVGACIRGATNVLAGLSVLAQQLEELRLGSNQLGPVQSFVENEHCCSVLPDVTEQLCRALLTEGEKQNINNNNNNNSNATHAAVSAAGESAVSSNVSGAASSSSSRSNPLPLRVLALDGNLLESSSCDFVANLVAMCPDLVSLNLSNNPNVGDVGVSAVAASLMGRNVEQLSVAKCGIAAAGTVAQLLAKTPSLVWLNAGDNALDSNGLRDAFAACRDLAQSKLQNLSLWNPDASVDPLPLLQYVVDALSGGEHDPSKWWSGGGDADAALSFPALRALDLGVTPRSGGKLLLPWDVVVEKGSEVANAAADIEFLLEKRRLLQACRK